MRDILGIRIEPRSKKEIINTIQNHLTVSSFVHVVSLNPEILVASYNNVDFKKIVNNAEVKLIDGVGVVLAGKILSVQVGERVAGVDLMKELISIAAEKELNVLILGGDENVSETLATKLQQENHKAKFKGMTGYQNVELPSSKEERHVQDVLKSFNPDLVFVAFGAPAQDIWIDDHKQFLKHSVCMSVGGAVDFLSGKVLRAPLFLRKIGLEWLFRLIIQPWRWRRQTRLLTFMQLVLKQKLSQNNS